METPFTLLLSLKTTDSYEAFGEIGLGTDRDFAYTLFDTLAGDNEIRENCHFHIDLIETTDSLPEKIHSKCCKLDELGENMKRIARDIFRQKNLNDWL